MAMMAALIRPEMGTVTNHAMKMFLNRRQSTAFLERSHPTATTEPTWKHSRQSSHEQLPQTSNYPTLTLRNTGSCSTFFFFSLQLFPRVSASPTTVFAQLTLQWVVETGRPMLEATTTVRAEASSMLKPLQGKNTSEEDVVVSEQRPVLCCLELLPRGGNGGQVLAHSLDHPATPHPEAGADAHAAVQQQPDGGGFIGSHAAGCVNQPQSY